jgi:hypothetical protein
LYSNASEKENKFSFKPQEAGEYKMSFTNPRNTPVSITYTLITDDSAKSDDPTQMILEEVVGDLRKVKEEQEFLMRREIEHKQGNFQYLIPYLVALMTNRRIIYWFVFQVSLIAATTYWQIYSLKGFFDTRRVV